ncbi:peptide deformylase [Candidatus Curtissbacteria bacterium]|nr:peptide deformylase [Candidatus Curtissbacteria bacterium]
MVKPIVTLPDNLLRQPSDEVVSFDRSLWGLIENLAETLETQHDPPGLGLSAVQIGVLKRVFVARIRNKTKAFVNPQILKFSKKEIPFLEGCFSVPLLYGHVARPAEIDLKFQDKLGKKVESHFKGVPARIIQHEVDHLNGTLFVDHVHNQNGKLFKIRKDKKGQEHLVELPMV